MENVVNNLTNKFFNIVIDTITSNLNSLENSSLSGLKSIFFIITMISLTLILLRMYFDKKEISAFKLPLIQIGLNYLLVNFLFIVIDKTNLYADIYNYYKEINQNNLILIIFLAIILVVLVDQLKTIACLISKSFSALYAFFNVPKMNDNIKENIVEISEEIISVFFLHFAFSSNLNIFFVFFIVISLKGFSKKLKFIMFGENEKEVITN